MYLRSILIAALSLALLSGCYEDTSSVTVVTQQLEPGISYRNDISGNVIDTLGNPLSNALVSIGGNSAVTDEDGAFSLDDIIIDEQGSHVAVSNIGYITTGLRLYPLKTLRQNVTITMVQEEPVLLIENASGGSILDNSGLELLFSPESVMRGSQLYVGSYQVRVFYIDPTDEANFERQLRAYDVANQVSSSLPKIDPLSMAYITITDDNGDKLDINPDKPVRVKFPVAENQNNLAPTVDLLSFDEEEGLWVDEGSAIQESDTYTAELDHFSWWTVSNIVETETLCLDFESNLSDPPRDNIFVVNTATGNHIYFGVVDYDNEICIPVPSDEELIINTYKYCVRELSEVTVNTADVGTGPYLIEISENTEGYKINVEIRDCDGSPLVGDYMITHSFLSQALEVSGDAFLLEVGECFDGDQVNIIVEDIQDGNIYTTTVDLIPGQVEYDTAIPICGDGFPEETVLIINDELYANCQALLNPQEVVIFSDNPSTLIGFDSPQVGVQSCRVITSGFTGEGTVEIKEFGIVGEFIVGKFESTNSLGDSAKGSFKALIKR